jgi:hypothetical protein
VSETLLPLAHWRVDVDGLNALSVLFYKDYFSNICAPTFHKRGVHVFAPCIVTGIRWFQGQASLLDTGGDGDRYLRGVRREGYRFDCVIDEFHVLCRLNARSLGGRRAQNARTYKIQPVTGKFI